MGMFLEGVGASSSSATMCVLKVPSVSVFTVLLVMVIHLGTLVGSTTATKMHYIHWNTSNPIFRIDNTDHIIDVNKNNFPFDYDQVNIICPTYDKSTKDHETEKYIIYNVSKEEYDTCRITTLHPRVITVCNKPYDLMYVTITFRPFSPQPNGLEFRPGVDYYFISTSSSDDLERRIGGRCSSHHMKVVFKVCCDPDKQQQAKPLGDQGGVQRGRNGPGNNNRRGDDNQHIIGTNNSSSSTSLLLHNNNANKTTSLSTAAKSGRTPSSSTSPTTTTTPSSIPRRRMPPPQRSPDVGMGGSSSSSSSSSYDYSDYAIHKDYPYYVKTTTRKVDTRKYPDPRENEVVENEALNRSPVPSTSHHLSLWWIMLVLLSTTMVVMGNGAAGGLGGGEESGESEAKRKRNAVQRRRDCDADRSGSLGGSCRNEARFEEGHEKVVSPTHDLCLTYNNSNNRHSYGDSSNNNHLHHHEFVLVPQHPRQHNSRLSCSSQQLRQENQQQRSGPQSSLTSITLSPPLTGRQSTQSRNWLQQRRKFSHQINSFRCRSRQHPCPEVTC